MATAGTIFKRCRKELLQGMEDMQDFLDDIPDPSACKGWRQAWHLFRGSVPPNTGFDVSKAGMQPMDDKAKAIHEALKLKCKKES